MSMLLKGSCAQIAANARHPQSVTGHMSVMHASATVQGRVRRSHEDSGLLQHVRDVAAANRHKDVVRIILGS